MRPGRLSDLGRLVKVHKLSWQVTYRGHMPDDALDNLPVDRWKAHWRKYVLAGKHLLVLAEGRAIRVFLNFGPTRDKDLDAKRISELYGIYLHPDHWRRGYGSRIAKAAIAILKEEDYDEVTLWVLRENSRARRFYENLGFSRMHGLKAEERYKNCMIYQVRYRMYLNDEKGAF